MPTESTPTAPQDPLDLLLRAADRVVYANSSFRGTMLTESIMHLNNAAQYMRTVQKPADTVQVSKQLMHDLMEAMTLTMNNARLGYYPTQHESDEASDLRSRIDKEVNGA